MIELRLRWHQQALHRLTREDVALHDFVDIADGDAAVPDLLGIHDDRNAEFTLIQTAGGIGTHLGLQAASRDRFLEGFAHVFAAAMLARTTRMVGGALVGTDEDMSQKSRHRWEW